MLKKVSLAVAVVAVLAAAAVWHLASRVESTAADFLESLNDGEVVVQVGSTTTRWFPRPAVEFHEVRVSAPAEPVARGRERELEASLAAALATVELSADSLFGSVEPVAIEFQSPLVRLSDADLRLYSAIGAEREAGTAPTWRLVGPTLSIGETRASMQELPLEGAVVEVRREDDGALAFSAVGQALGEGGTIDIGGRLLVGAGATGGHRLECEYAIVDAEVETLRAIFPERFHPSFGGRLSFRGSGEGFLGETSSEMAPAAPLVMSGNGSIDWTLVEHTDPLLFDLDMRVSDGRVRFDKGTLAWGGIELGLLGWTDLARDPAFVLRGRFEKVDTAAVASRLGVGPEWTPRSTLSGELRYEGEPGRQPGRRTLSYTADARSIALDGVRGYAIRAESPRLQGRLLAANAVVQMSVGVDSIAVGDIDFPAVRFGGRWFRRELTAASVGLELWKGKLDFSIGYRPDDKTPFVLGAQLLDLDAQAVADEILPQLGVNVDGRLHSAFTYEEDAGQPVPRLLGRAGLYRARWKGIDFATALFDALAVEPGVELLTPPIVGAFPNTFTAGETPVRRLLFDMERRDDAIALEGLAGWLGELRIRASGTLRDGDRIAIRGGVEISPALTTELVARHPSLSVLVGDDERLDVPVELVGPVAALKVSVPEDFRRRLAAAFAGEPVDPYEALELPGIEMEIPPLPGSQLSRSR